MVNAPPTPAFEHSYELKQNVDYSKAVFGYLG
jgi:hypothetical protein